MRINMKKELNKTYSPREIEEKWYKVWEEKGYFNAQHNGEKTGYIANLGHGITQWVDPAQPKIFVDTVHAYSQKYLG